VEWFAVFSLIRTLAGNELALLSCTTRTLMSKKSWGEQVIDQQQPCENINALVMKWVQTCPTFLIRRNQHRKTVQYFKKSLIIPLLKEKDYLPIARALIVFLLLPLYKQYEVHFVQLQCLPRKWKWQVSNLKI
jgi:hypothetical protein